MLSPHDAAFALFTRHLLSLPEAERPQFEQQFAGYFCPAFAAAWLAWRMANAPAD
ncbi:MAG: hypothetical protein U1A07_08700 [Phenylobacterium sp.]|nr:hypothetical protein [Phenylobacterium sp.]